MRKEDPQKYASVKCPHCGYAVTKTLTSSYYKGDYRRTRRCARESCGKMFNCYEISASDMAVLRAIKRAISEGGSNEACE